MRRLQSLLLTGTMICVLGPLSAGAQEAEKKPEMPRIPGGIEGHLKSVDVEKGTLTITTASGTARTFSVSEDTTMLGPRGGKVRRRLHDPRFHEGMAMTVVASGSTAKEVHLGYRHRASGSAGESEKTTANSSAAKERTRGVTTTAPAARAKVSKEKDSAAASKPAASEEEDEDDEIPGTVKSYNADRRLLVVSLLNGTSRPFFLSRDLKVLVRGVASEQGIADPSLKEGAHVTVLVEEGGRRVKELHVDPAPPARRTKKAA
jgi:hypothetical protein